MPAVEEKMVAVNVFSATIAASLTSILLNVFIVRVAMGWLDRKALTSRRTLHTEQE